MSGRSRSSAGSRRGWSRTTSRPEWTSRTCMTRRSTGPMLSSPRITAAWLTRRAIKPRDKARVERPMPYVRDCSGGAGVHLARADAGRGGTLVRGSRGDGRAGRWTAPPGRGVRGREETGAAAAARRAVRAGHLGAAKIGPDIDAQVDGFFTPCRGSTSARRRRAADPGHGAVLHRREAGQDPPRKARGKQTDFCDYRRRRSRSTCGPPRRAASRPRGSGWHASRSSRSCSPRTRFTGCELRRA